MIISELLPELLLDELLHPEFVLLDELLFLLEEVVVFAAASVLLLAASSSFALARAA